MNVQARSLLLALIVLVGVPAFALADPRVTVSVDGGLLSLAAEEAPLDRILIEIGRSSRLEIKLESGLASQFAKETTSVQFRDLTVEDGLRRLLQKRSMILIYDASGLTEVRIYEQGSGGFQSLTSARPAGIPFARRVPPEGGVRALRDRERPTAPEKSAVDALSSKLEELSNQGDERAAAQVAFDVLERERDPELLETALGGLVGLTSVPVEPLLRFAASQRDPDLRVQALELLGEHGGSDPRVTELLTKLTQESNEDVRDAARNALESLQSDSSDAPPSREPSGGRAPLRASSQGEPRPRPR